MDSKLSGVVLKHVFNCMTCHEVAQSRLVCKKFHVVGNNLLNEKFANVCKNIILLVKNNLKCHWMSLSDSVIMRKKLIMSTNSILLMLRVVFGRYITSARCSFYPGQIIDYAEKLIYKLRTNNIIRSDKQVLKKLYNYSKYAMNHFETFIEPDLPGPSTFNGTKIIDTLSTYTQLQTVETDRTSFFEKVCEMFPQDIPLYLKHKHDPGWLIKLRKQILVSNKVWLSQQLQSRPRVPRQKKSAIVKLKSGEKKLEAKNRIFKNDKNVFHGVKRKHCKQVSKKFDLDSSAQNLNSVTTQPKLQKKHSVSSARIKQSKFEIKPSTSGEVRRASASKIEVTNSDSVATPHKFMSEDLIRTMVNARKFIKEVNTEKSEQCDDLRSKKRKAITEQLKSYKKYCNFEPYTSENILARDIKPQDLVSQVPKPNKLSDEKCQLYQNNEMLPTKKSFVDVPLQQKYNPQAIPLITIDE